MAHPVETKHLFNDARAFLDDLAANNSRAWFKQNKTRYDNTLKRPAERLMADLAVPLSRSYGAGLKTKLFRPHRDLRFSEDKTPYHVHLHMMWSLPDGRAWMFGIAPDYASFGAGIMQFTPEQLTRWRNLIAEPDGAELESILDAGVWRTSEAELKRVPPPHSTEHPRAGLLRRKSLVVWQDGLDEQLQSDALAALTKAAQSADPVMRWLEHHI